MQACILRPKRMYPVRQIFTPGLFGTEFKAEWGTMKLNRFILPLNLRTVQQNLGRLTQLFGILMSAPLLVSVPNAFWPSTCGRNVWRYFRCWW